jgi:hypothetical protein
MNQQFQHKENMGSLFKNDKGDNPNRPDYTGDANINGEVMRVSAWVKEGQKGKYMSLSFSVPTTQQKAPQKPVKQAPKQEFDDSDVPF